MEDEKKQQEINELVLKAKVDKAAFTQLYNLYKGQIFGYLYNYLGDYSKAEEICQQTFISCYKHLASYEPRRKFSSWLYKIATNLAKDEIRRAKRHEGEVSLEAPIKKGEGKTIVYGDVIPDESLRPDIEPRQKELEAHILGVINSLPDKYKEVLLLCDVQGLSYEEAARILNSVPGTIGTQLRRARKLFRQKIKLEFGDLNFYLRILRPLRLLKKGMDKMMCLIIRPILSFYMDGRCLPAAARWIERHLEACPDCYAELNALQETVILLGQLNPVLALSAGFDAAFEGQLAGVRVKRIDLNWQRSIDNLQERLNTLLPPVWTPRPLPILVPARSIVSILLIVILSISYFHNYIGYLPQTLITTGQCFVYNAKKMEKIPLVPGMKLAKGDIVYADTGLVDLDLDDAYKIRLKKGTQLGVNSLTRSRTKGTTDLSLYKGIMLAMTQKRFSGSKMRITTPTGTAQVVGTRFMLIVSEDQTRTDLLVENGMVKFRSHYKKDMPGAGSLVTVFGNYKIVTKANELPSVPVPLTTEEEYALTEIDKIGQADGMPDIGMPINTEEISRIKIALGLSMTPQRVYELFRPCTIAINVTDGRKAEIHTMLEDAIELHKTAEKEDDKQLYMASIEKFKTAYESHPSEQYSPHILLYAGSCYVQLLMHEEALEAFNIIVTDYPESKWASIAQCAAGIIYEKKLNNPRKARRAYKNVIENYQDSLEVAEAEAGLSRLK